MRKDGKSAIVVPDEGPPLDRDGTPRWPPGWGPGRTVETEQDIFELLGCLTGRPTSATPLEDFWLGASKYLEPREGSRPVVVTFPQTNPQAQPP